MFAGKDVSGRRKGVSKAKKTFFGGKPGFLRPKTGFPGETDASDVGMNDFHVGRVYPLDEIESGTLERMHS
jgi:hypothetical protein